MFLGGASCGSAMSGTAGKVRSVRVRYVALRLVKAGKVSLGKFWSCGVRQAWLGPFSYGSARYGLVWQARFGQVLLG